MSWLAGITPFAVSIAADGTVPLAGTVYVPPADRHLRLEQGRLRISSAPPVYSQRPSGSVLLSSMARGFLGRRGIGVILTGMGSDGSDGLAEMKTAGGYTIAEDELTLRVFGMPAAAAKQGAVMEMLPLPAIAGRLQQLAEGGGP